MTSVKKHFEKGTNIDYDVSEETTKLQKELFENLSKQRALCQSTKYNRLFASDFKDKRRMDDDAY